MEILRLCVIIALIVVLWPIISFVLGLVVPIMAFLIGIMIHHTWCLRAVLFLALIIFLAEGV
jgi:hypothetical protein